MKEGQADIWVIDDVASMSQLGVAMLSDIEEVDVHAVTRASEWLEKLSSQPSVGVVVCDVCMPDIDGVELARLLKVRAPWLRVILFTGQIELPMVINALRIGVFDFLEKPLNHASLNTTVEKALEASSKAVAQWIAHEDAKKRLESLTKREYQVAALLCQGFTNKEIATQLELSARTIDIHRSHIMMRAQCQSFAELLQLWILANPAQPVL